MPIKALFVRESGAGYLLTGLASLSLLLIAIESSTGLLQPVRAKIEGVASPVYLLAEAPHVVVRQVGEVLSTHADLRQRNLALQRQILELTHISQQFVALKAENERLQELLGSQGRLPHEVLIAEVVGIVPDPGTFQVIIDKGGDAGLVAGQAVLDAQGLFGQVVTVSPFTSRVLLITDRNHAVPVQINRNGVRSVAGGTGILDRLELENVPVSSEIVEGDLVETSGLGGRFPVGYPVGRVTSVLVEPTSSYVQVVVQASAELDRSRHVLVIFEPRTVAP